MTGNQGFSLAEVALSLAIFAVVLGALVPGFLSLRSAEQARATRSALETVMRASAAFVQANGCLPCPSTYDSLFNNAGGFGRVRGAVSGGACGACTTAVGFVPFRSLGLPQSMARDGYGRYLTFAIDTALTTFTVVPPNAPCQENDPAPCTPADNTAHIRKKGLCSAPISNDRPLHVVPADNSDQQAVILVLSHGQNGRGAYSERLSVKPRLPVAYPPNFCGTAQVADNCPELWNTDNDATFVAANAATGDDPFDDQMLYLDRNALVSSLGNEACQTAWP